MKHCSQYLLFLFIMLCMALDTHAQIVVNENAGNTVTKDTEQGIVIHSDPRLAVLLKKHKNAQLGVIRSGQGYRVQIYNGNDRVKANQIKVDFMRRFPGIRTYLTYVQPQFRVKVGDFRTRAEAYELYKKVSNIYNPSMIVPDIVVINTLKDD